MDDIQKALQKLSTKEQQTIKDILTRLARDETSGLNIKKLKNRNDIFRIRKGDIRLIYQKQDNHIMILAVKRRNEKTYK